MFFVHTTPEKFKNATITGYFGFVFEETLSGKSRDYHDVIISEKLRLQIVLCSHENVKSAFSDSSCLKSVFLKLLFCDGVVWTVGLTVDMKIRIQTSLTECARCLMVGLIQLPRQGVLF